MATGERVALVTGASRGIGRGCALHLARAGFDLTTVRDAHLCCGSSGTYSLLHPAIAQELRSRKLAALNEGGPDSIATANIGCLSHLQAASPVPVRHWIEVLDQALQRKMPA